LGRPTVCPLEKLDFRGGTQDGFPPETAAEGFGGGGEESTL